MCDVYDTDDEDFCETRLDQSFIGFVIGEMICNFVYMYHYKYRVFFF